MAADSQTLRPILSDIFKYSSTTNEMMYGALVSNYREKSSQSVNDFYVSFVTCDIQICYIS